MLDYERYGIKVIYYIILEIIEIVRLNYKDKKR